MPILNKINMAEKIQLVCATNVYVYAGVQLENTRIG